MSFGTSKQNVAITDALPTGGNVIGQVTANAGTNLNTSALALEAGGNLAAIAASLAILDDFDESDRAKVNIIVGQPGVAAGSGVVSADTQRVVLATDVALPTGTNNIGDVDVLSVVPGTSATSLGKAEDAAHVSGDTGVLLLGVRRDADSSSVDTDGDYAPVLVDANGFIKVNIKASTSLTTTEANSASIAASLAIMDDWDETDRAKVNPIAGQAGVAGGSGTVSALTQRVVLATDVGLPAGTSNIGDVDILSIIPGTGATNLGKAEDAAHVSGDTGVLIFGVSNEANTARASDGDYIPLATDTEGNVRMVGNRDHDAVDAGEPVKIGMKAVDFGADPTEVAALDRVDALATRHGIQWVLGGMPNLLRANVTMSTATTSDLITATASERIIITEVSAFASDDNTGNVAITINHDLSAVDTRIAKHPAIPVGSGFVEGTGAGVLSVGPVGGKVEVTSDAAQTVEVHATYFKIPSA